jgi:hypothetical protein
MPLYLTHDLVNDTAFITNDLHIGLKQMEFKDYYALIDAHTLGVPPLTPLVVRDRAELMECLDALVRIFGGDKPHLTCCAAINHPDQFWSFEVFYRYNVMELIIEYTPIDELNQYLRSEGYAVNDLH